jgi:hypothetical protein
VVGRPIDRAALDQADALPAALDNRWRARCGEVQPRTGMDDAAPVELRDRAEDRGRTVIDVVGETDRVKACQFQRLAGDGRIGEKALLLDAMPVGWMLEQAFEITEDGVGLGESALDPAKRHRRVVDIHQIDVANQDQRGGHRSPRGA